jgi:hypothetical protein
MDQVEQKLDTVIDAVPTLIPRTRGDPSDEAHPELRVGLSVRWERLTGRA